MRQLYPVAGHLWFFLTSKYVSALWHFKRYTLARAGALIHRVHHLVVSHAFFACGPRGKALTDALGKVIKLIAKLIVKGKAGLELTRIVSQRELKAMI